MVRDLSGRALPQVKGPSDSVILTYLDHVKQTPLPPLQQLKDNMVALKSHPAVHYKIETGWVNVLTGKKVLGLRAPSITEEKESSF